jgi:hypothetical protein
MLGMSRSSFYRSRQLDNFPKGRRLGVDKIVYAIKDIEQYLANLPVVDAPTSNRAKALVKARSVVAANRNKPKEKKHGMD